MLVTVAPPMILILYLILSILLCRILVINQKKKKNGANMGYVTLSGKAIVGTLTDRPPHNVAYVLMKVAITGPPSARATRRQIRVALYLR